jgi:acetyl esterase
MDYIITRDTLLSGYEMYLARADRKHPEASPLWREDFSGRRCISDREYDPLRDEGEALYQRLTEQGVSVPAQRWLG